LSPPGQVTETGCPALGVGRVSTRSRGSILLHSGGLTTIREVSMLTRIARLSLLTTAAGAAVLLAAGCTSSVSSSPGGASPAAALAPKQAIPLAAHYSANVSSVKATISITGSSPAVGGVDLAGTLREQLRPSVLAAADFPTLGGGGQSVPGGISEVINS